jgi:tetratricopeptide (TPR) repeat protein
LKTLIGSLAALVLLASCVKPPVYKQTFEQARTAGNKAEAKQLAVLAMKQAEEAGAGCKIDYDYITSFLEQTVTEAERAEIYERALAAAQKARTCENREKVLCNRFRQLGNYYLTKKQYEKATPNLREAVVLGVKVFGSDAKELAGIRDASDPSAGVMYPSSWYAELARSYEGQGDFADAERWRRQDLTIREKYFGPNGSPPGFDPLGSGVVDQINALARDLAYQNKLDEAEKLYLRAIDVNKRNFAAKSQTLPDFCPVEFAGLAEVYRRQGRMQEAEKAFKRALTAFESGPQQPGTIDPRRMEAQGNYCKLLRDTGRSKEAEQFGTSR